jgi:hypothetical protein
VQGGQVGLEVDGHGGYRESGSGNVFVILDLRFWICDFGFAILDFGLARQSPGHVFRSSLLVIVKSKIENLKSLSRTGR